MPTTTPPLRASWMPGRLMMPLAMALPLGLLWLIYTGSGKAPYLIAAGVIVFVIGALLLRQPMTRWFGAGLLLGSALAVFLVVAPIAALFVVCVLADRPCFSF